MMTRRRPRTRLSAHVGTQEAIVVAGGVGMETVLALIRILRHVVAFRLHRPSALAFIYFILALVFPARER